MKGTEHWLALAELALPRLLAQPALCDLADDVALLLHGSTSFGVEDEFSDLDFWLLLPEARLAELDSRSPTRFFEFEVDGKYAHANASSQELFASRAMGCDMPLLAELRSARVLRDPHGHASALLEQARRPMRLEVRAAWFCFHYVEMRGDHKASKNPTSRGDALATLLFAAKVVAHALRAALILDGEPYPYDKWLAHAARRTPTGAQVEAATHGLLDLLARDALRLQRDETEHPLRPVFAELRRVLVEAAHESGIEGPWLDDWWLHIDAARAGVRDLPWSAGDRGLSSADPTQ